MRAVLALGASLLAAAGAHAQGRYVPVPPSIGEAPPHLKYMSPRCAALHDAIRTGPARGLSGQTLAASRKEYSLTCTEDERDAYQQLAREKQEKVQQKRSEQQALNQAQERTRQQEQLCGESKRILKMKKARTDLSEGEKADLKRFEDNYLARCS